MNGRKEKILFIGEGITMTHFMRPAALAATLDREEWDVSFATPKRYHSLLCHPFTHLLDLPSLSPERFLDALAHARVLYDYDTLQTYIRHDQEILKMVEPDLVIGDYRLSLAISAPLQKIPFASIFNAHWSPYADQPAIVPPLPITRWIPPPFLNPLYSLVQPMIYKHHAKPVNDLRQEHSLAPIGSLQDVYTAGDLTFYPDVPEFVPLRKTAPTHHFVGICPWELPVEKPAWWHEVVSSPLQKVFISLGSSGPVNVLPSLLQALSSLSVQVLLATSGRDVGAVPTNVFIAPYLPYEATSRLSALVISQGGTGGLYFALAAGTPHLAIPNNVDNLLSVERLKKSGAGLSVRMEEANVQRLSVSVERLLQEPSYKRRAMEWAEIIRRYDTRTLFPQRLREFFKN